MRTERNKDGTYNCWMSREEYQEVPRQASSFEREIALRLMGDCGLRVAEVLDVHPEHISRAKDGKHHMLEVVAGKDTSGEYDGGKQRETWLPVELERQIHRYIREEDIVDEEALIQCSKKTLQNWVTWSAEAAAEQTGDIDYERISSHDLRRCWAHHLLVERGVNPRIVMALGGWSSYDAIEPYLNAPTEDNIIDAMRDIDL